MKSRLHKLLRTTSAKNLLAIYSSDTIIRILNIFRAFFVAKILRPEDYGILKSVQLISDLAKYGNLGLMAVVRREIPYYSSDTEKAEYIKGNAYTFDMVIALALFFVALSLFFVESLHEVRWLVFFSALAMVSARFSRFTLTESYLQGRFVLQSRVVVVSGLFVTVGVIATVPYFRIYSSVIFPALGSLLTFIILFYKLPFRFSFHVNFGELRRQLKIGLPLVAGSLIYGLHRYSERILVLSLYGLKSAGLYGFASVIMDQVLSFSSIALSVRSLELKKILGTGDHRSAHKLVMRETFIVISCAFFLCVLVIGLVPYAIRLLLGEYSESIIYCQVMLLIVPVRMASLYIDEVIVSPIVNRQSLQSILYGCIVAVFAGCVLFLHWNTELSLKNFIIIDICSFIALSGSNLFLYYYFFYREHVNCSVHVKQDCEL